MISWLNQHLMQCKSLSAVPVRFVPLALTKRCFSSSFEIESEEPLGEGQFGPVYKGKKFEDSKYYAIKHLFKFDRSEAEKEISIMQTVEHKNVLKGYQSYEDSKHFYMVTELCEGGTMMDWNAKKLQSEKDIKMCLFQICEGMDHLNHKGIVHLDLKTGNVCIMEKKFKSIKDATLKIIDFGLAVRTAKLSGKVRTKFGTTIFMGPENCEGSEAMPEISVKDLPKCDVWSAGVIAFKSLCGCFPFEFDDDYSESKLERKIKKGEYDFPSNPKSVVSKKAKQFIKRCLTKDLASRPTFAELLQDPWFDSVRGSTGLLRRDHEVIEPLSDPGTASLKKTKSTTIRDKKTGMKSKKKKQGKGTATVDETVMNDNEMFGRLQKKKNKQTKSKIKITV